MVNNNRIGFGFCNNLFNTLNHFCSLYSVASAPDTKVKMRKRNLHLFKEYIRHILIIVLPCMKNHLFKAVGKLVAERAEAKGINAVVFDRGGYIFHGRVAALAEAAREAGLTF